MPTLRINNNDLEAELILFDLDGTLVDDHARYRMLAKSRMKVITKKVSMEAAETWARLEGVTPGSFQIDMDGPLSKAPRREDLTVAAVALYLHGYPWYEARELSKAIYEEADEIQRENYTPQFFPNTREKLEELRTIGFRLGVATNGETSLTKEILEKVDAINLFEIVVGADMVNEGKPAPDMIHKACELARTSPKKTVYFGDQLTDVQAAKSAGVAYIVGIGGNELLEEGADIVVGSISELMNFFK